MMKNMMNIARKEIKIVIYLVCWEEAAALET
jgi:hypothetical protein